MSLPVPSHRAVPDAVLGLLLLWSVPVAAAVLAFLLAA